MISSSVSIAPDEVAAHYDSLDRFYREIWGEHVHHGFWEKGSEKPEEAVIHLSQTLARWMKIREGDQLVDVGCGYGGTSRLLASEYKADVIGFTLSKEQQKYAAAKAPTQGRVDIRCQDFLTHTLPESTIDGVISIECLEHVEDKQKAFDEISRILKPGKRMAVALWSAHETPNRVQAHLLEAICREGRLPGMPSGPEYAALIENAGLQLVEQREISQQVKKTWMICAQRLAKKIATDSTYRNFLRNSSEKDRVFALTLLRIIAAFETKAMKYWIFAAEKPIS